MPLPRPLSALLTTIVAAVPAAITTVVLNKPKPPREIDKVIELDENTETISEPEIIPKEAPPLPAPQPPQKPEGSQHSSIGEPGSQDGETLSSEDEESESTSSQQDDSDAETNNENREDETTEKAEEEEKVEEEEEAEDDEGEDDVEPPQDTSSEDDSLSEEEIKKALLEVIKSLNEKQGFNLQTADLYPLFKVNFEIGQLISLIKQLKDLEQKKKSEAAAENVNPGGSSAGSGIPSKSP